MRLVSWNCQHGDCRDRAARLAGVSADVIVLQECSRPLLEDERCIWFPTIPTKGVGIVAKEPWTVTAGARAAAGGFESIYPVEVSGPSSFHLLAVWAQREPTYVRAMLDGLDRYAEFITAKATVIVGDFNSDPELKSSKARSEHELLKECLAGYGLVSASHAYSDRVGTALRPTYYHQRKEDRPYHLDYCFVPESWIPRLTVEIGGYAEWNGESDHRPIWVDIREG
jgi:endonuclease/exonuclease/phosphatase family metal-dependent hydrolase